MTIPQTTDFLAVGETLRDVFYMIDEATVSCSINKDRCLLCLEYAEKIPVKHVVKVHAAGNSANAAVSAARLGFKSSLVSWIGKDAEGQDIKEALRREKVNENNLCDCEGQKTSEAAILSFQGERTQLVSFKPRQYTLHEWPKAKVLYYSAMGEKYSGVDKAILTYLRKNPKTVFVFQPGTTHVRHGLKPMKPLIAQSKIFILNKDEAHHLLGDGGRPMLNLLESFHHLGTQCVVITDGEKGADAFDGHAHWHMPIFPGKSLERTGAGDSFASAFACALLHEFDVPTALRWGTADAWSVIQKIGPQAGLLTKSEIQKTLKKFNHLKPETVS
ncbi:MAG: carbohydrate kinase family protein [Patescibacteria group bacterium]|jgi:ribokinase